jgi:transposase-like protein
LTGRLKCRLSPPPIPRIARVPHTSKQPDACPRCGGRNVTRRGTRKKKLEIVQLWRCASCKCTFTPGPAALRNKTYPLRMILLAVADYDQGYSLKETAARLKKKSGRSVSHSTISAWLEEYKSYCTYRRLRGSGLSLFPANQTTLDAERYDPEGSRAGTGGYDAVASYCQIMRAGREWGECRSLRTMAL